MLIWHTHVSEWMFYTQLPNSYMYGPISPEKTLLKCSRFDEKPAEITNSCEVKFFLLCYWAKVIPVQWLSSKLSCAEKMTLVANLMIELKCQNVEHLPFGILGPLHMSPVNRAGSVSEISPCHSFLCKNIDVFIWEAGLARLPRSRFLRPISR